MTVSLDLNPIQTAITATLGSLAVGLGDATEIEVFGLFRKGAMGSFAHRRRSDDRQPIAGAPSSCGDRDG